MYSVHAKRMMQGQVIAAQTWIGEAAGPEKRLHGDDLERRLGVEYILDAQRHSGIGQQGCESTSASARGWESIGGEDIMKNLVGNRGRPLIHVDRMGLIEPIRVEIICVPSQNPGLP